MYEGSYPVFLESDIAELLKRGIESDIAELLKRGIKSQIHYFLNIAQFNTILSE